MRLTGKLDAANKKRNETYDAEQRSKAGKKRENAMRQNGARKMAVVKALATKGPEGRAAAAKKR